MTWLVTGNSNITTSNFLGPTNTAPLIIKTSNTERMRIASDGNVSVGGTATRATYKLDVYGTLHADEIYKNGSPLISSQWTDVTGGINYAAGSVGIGAVDTAYTLNVAGTINTTDFRKNGSPLSVSQWTDVAGGINYAVGNVGIGAPNPHAGLEISKGATNDLALLLSSSGPGWASRMQFQNTAQGGKTYGIYSGWGSLHFADVDNGVDRLIIDNPSCPLSG